MNANPLFSIVIVNYNHGEFLEEAIKSIFSQDCKDYELIIIDGGSNDNSYDIICKYKNRLSFWVSEKDNGQSIAFNKGFNNAVGQFFFWLNADDILLPKTLEKAKAFINNNSDCKWLSGDMVLMNLNNKIIKMFKGPKWNNYLVKNTYPYIFGPSSFFHRSLFHLDNGFNEDLKFSMDTDLWMRFVNHGYKFQKLNHYCWGFRLHQNSKTSHAFKGKANNKFENEKKIVYSKNGFKKSRIFNFLLFIFKVFTGTYIISIYHTYLYNGKNIKSLNV